MSIQRIVQDGRLLITVSGGAPPSRYIPYPPFPGTATEKKQKSPHRHIVCPGRIPINSTRGTTHIQVVLPCHSLTVTVPTCTQRVIPPAAHTRRFGNGNAPRRLLLTEDCLRVRPPSEVHSPLLPPPRFHRAAALCGILSGATPLHLWFEWEDSITFAAPCQGGFPKKLMSD